MSHESYCADRLRSLEGEEFLAVGDDALARRLNPRFEEDRRHGRAERLPDLLSIKDGAYRLREVKFRLEEKLVAKAVSQLRRGAELLGEPVDRLEIVVPLYGRALKPAEQALLGARVESERFRLAMDSAITVLLL